MKFEDLTNEQLEKAKACTTGEERVAFLKEHNIELPDDLLDEVAGGSILLEFYQEAENTVCTDNPVYKDCPKANGRNHGRHCWVWTKNTKNIRSKEFPYNWTENEFRCKYCGLSRWD